MTRGQIVIITNDGLIKSREFNGGMSKDCLGEEIYKNLKRIDKVEQYKKFVQDFENKHFNYDKGLYYQLFYQYKNKEIRKYKMYDMSHAYLENWFSDYLYIKNISDNRIIIIDRDKKSIELNSGDIVVLRFGEDVTNRFE